MCNRQQRRQRQQSNDVAVVVVVIIIVINIIVVVVNFIPLQRVCLPAVRGGMVEVEVAVNYIQKPSSRRLLTIRRLDAVKACLL